MIVHVDSNLIGALIEDGRCADAILVTRRLLRGAPVSAIELESPIDACVWCSAAKALMGEVQRLPVDAATERP